MRIIKLTIAYDGTEYSGWQRQKNAPTIQETIEDQLERIHTHPVTLHGAGRTDAGVHAKGMVAHFNTQKDISSIFFQKALNSMLPSNIRILAAEHAPNDFHARFSAKGKTYIYSINTASILLPTQRLYSTHISTKLNLKSMQQCLDFITGTHDFSCFETTGSRDKNAQHGRGAVRTISQAEIKEEGAETLHFIFTGDGFLRHMIRNIMGTVLDVGRGKRDFPEFQEILHSADRKKAGTTAPAHGLTLYQVFY